MTALIKRLLSVFNWRTLVIRYRKIKCARDEAGNIHTAIRGGSSQVIIVYDNFVSPPTYGDYLHIVLVARYFIAQGIKVEFYIVDSEYRQDWNLLNESEIKHFVSEQIKIAEALLNSPLAKIQLISWNECQSELLYKSADSFVLFIKHVQNREAIYSYCFNMLNQLLNDSDHGLVERTLLSYDELSHNVKIVPPNNKYVTWACRHSKKWAIERNISENEFIRIYAHLRQNFPHHSIMIVSDAEGCKHFADLAQKLMLECIFSKQYSQTFLGDGALILNSDFFFQVRGGGIAIIPMYSKIPYEITAPMVHESMWSKNKATSWQHRSQLFINKSVYSIGQAG